MKIVLATNNKHKTKEFSRILSPLGIEIISQEQAGINIEVEENADTFEGNARLKAKAIFDLTKFPTIADDSGLEVIYLGNKPGVYSARYGGSACKDDVQRYELLLKNLENVPDEKRDAQFVCAIHLFLSENEEYSFTGVCKGKIGHKPLGENGFGYDPIFMVGNQSFSQLDGEKKDEISHRGNATKQLYNKLSTILKDEEIK